MKSFIRGVIGQGRVLDLGWWPGRDVRLLTELGCQAMGLDLSTGVLAQALPPRCQGSPAKDTASRL